MPAMRVLVNTSSPQGSTGITTNLQPAMTLGCGAAAGNATSDNIGPLNLINIKRVAYSVRRPEEAFPHVVAAAAVAVGHSGTPDRATVVAAVERYLAARGVAPQVAQQAASNTAVEVVDRFLSRRSVPTSGGYGSMTGNGVAPQPSPAAAPVAAPAPSPKAVDFVCEADVRAAIRDGRKIYIGAKTIVTPAARELAGPSDILVITQG
jgi:acetaldehyde dehydrogenase (acetylating)